MAVELGQDWRIKAGDGGGSEAFDLLGGETTFSWASSNADIDTSSKSDGDYVLGTYGRRSVTFNVSGKVTLPDDGFERFLDVSRNASSKKLNIQVVKGAIVKYQGEVAIGNFSADFPDQQPVTYSFTLRASAVPSVDDLGASS